MTLARMHLNPEMWSFSSSFLSARLCLIISFVGHNIPGRSEGQDGNPCDIPVKSSHYTHACQLWLGNPCLPRSNGITRGSSCHTSGLEDSSRVLPFVYSTDKRRTDTVSSIACTGAQSPPQGLCDFSLLDHPPHTHPLSPR